MQNEATDSILDRKPYESVLAKVSAYNQQHALTEQDYQQYLQDYIELLAQRDKGYPLLLRDGTNLVLESPPAEHSPITGYRRKKTALGIADFSITHD